MNAPTSMNSHLPLPVSPGPVGNMRVSNTSLNQLTVTWTPPTAGGVPTSYNVSINDSSSPVVIHVPDNGSSLYTHTFTGLISDTLYTVSVVAINCAVTSNVVTQTKWTGDYGVQGYQLAQKNRKLYVAICPGLFSVFWTQVFSLFLSKCAIPHTKSYPYSHTSIFSGRPS